VFDSLVRNFGGSRRNSGEIFINHIITSPLAPISDHCPVNLDIQYGSVIGCFNCSDKVLAGKITMWKINRKSVDRCIESEETLLSPAVSQVSSLHDVIS